MSIESAIAAADAQLAAAGLPTYTQMNMTTPTRPRGRPAGTTKGRDARVEWSTTPERKARVRALAEAAGLTVAAWLDRVVDRARA